jgi:hypothetical protein
LSGGLWPNRIIYASHWSGEPIPVTLARVPGPAQPGRERGFLFALMRLRFLLISRLSAVCYRMGGQMDNTTLLIIIVLVLLLFGGGFYGRGRWW